MSALKMDKPLPCRVEYRGIEYWGQVAETVSECASILRETSARAKEERPDRRIRLRLG